MAEASVRVDRSGGCAWVTLDRPPLNLLDPPLIYSLAETFDQLSQDESVRAAVIGGAGPHMTAGMQVEEMRDLSASSAKALIGGLRHAIDSVFNAPFPTVAMVHGACLGAGFELMLACDLRVVSSDARMGLPEVQLGIPSVIHAALLPDAVGSARAAELLLTGKAIGAREALEWGLVNRVVEREQLYPATAALVDEMLRCGPQSIRLQKELMIRWRRSDMASAIEAGVDVFARSFATDEPRQAMQAFLEKRSPGFGP